MIKIIFGLGNPGKEYIKTRHNLGFLVLDELAEKHNIRISRKSPQSVWGEGIIASKKIILVKPATFMNLSGTSAKICLSKFDLKPSEALVVCDDLNLDPGKIRIRKGGSSGGHNGLKSISEKLQTDQFPRLRIGIGAAPEYKDSADFVLDKFSKNEWKFYEEVIKNTADVLEYIIKYGVENAMNKYN